MSHIRPFKIFYFYCLTISSNNATETKRKTDVIGSIQI